MQNIKFKLNIQIELAQKTLRVSQHNHMNEVIAFQRGEELRAATYTSGEASTDEQLPPYEETKTTKFNTNAVRTPSGLTRQEGGGYKLVFSMRIDLRGATADGSRGPTFAQSNSFLSFMDNPPDELKHLKGPHWAVVSSEVLKHRRANGMSVLIFYFLFVNSMVRKRACVETKRRPLCHALMRSEVVWFPRTCVRKIEK